MHLQMDYQQDHQGQQSQHGRVRRGPSMASAEACKLLREMDRTELRAIMQERGPVRRLAVNTLAEDGGREAVQRNLQHIIKKPRPRRGRNERMQEAAVMGMYLAVFGVNRAASMFGVNRVASVIGVYRAVAAGKAANISLLSDAPRGHLTPLKHMH